MKELEACREEAMKMKLVETAFEITLAEAEVQAAPDPKAALARLQSLQGDAKAKGYLRVVADADRARQELVRKSQHTQK
jgi:hypothetical protein